MIKEKKIIQIFLYINILIFLYGYFKGFFKPYWFDEVASIAFAKNFDSLSLIEIFTQDTHSPFFYFILFLGQKILELFNLKFSDYLIYLRSINLIGIIPIYFSYKILKNNFSKQNLEIILLLLISNHFFFYFSLELRMYFILLSFSFLINVINYNNSLENNHKYLFLISSIILSMLHVFGLTISMSILLYRFVLNYIHRNYKNCKINFSYTIILLIVFILFYGPSLVNGENMKMFRWVKNNLWYYRVFIEWTLNLFITLTFIGSILLLKYKSKIFKLKYINNFFNSSFFENITRILFPTIILMITTLLISFLFAPVITYRNLVVVVPNLILLNGIFCYFFLKIKKSQFIIFILLTLITIINLKYYYTSIITSNQNIKWVVKNTFNKNCEHVPVYYNDAGRKNFLKQYVEETVNVYAEYSRPIKNLSDLNPKIILQNFKLSKKCKTFIFSFHIPKLEYYIQDLKKSGIYFEINYAPDVKVKNSKSGAIAKIKD